MPLSVGSVASNTGKTPSASQLQNLALSILRRSFIISSSDGMAMACIKTITNFLIPGTWRQGRPRKTWSECVKTNVHECGLAETEMHGELLFSIAWCCQPHRMAHGQHLNLNWIWMGGWSQATSHYLSQCLSRSMSPCGFTRPQWVYCNILKTATKLCSGLIMSMLIVLQ